MCDDCRPRLPFWEASVDVAGSENAVWPDVLSRNLSRAGRCLSLLRGRWVGFCGDSLALRRLVIPTEVFGFDEAGQLLVGPGHIDVFMVV